MKVVKFFSAAELNEFFEVLSRCTSDVRFVSYEGDILNLRSRLCQFLFSAAALNDELTIKGELLFSDEADREVLSQYFNIEEV